MLDDLKMIHDRDSADLLGAAGRQWRQLTHVLAVDAGIGLSRREIGNVIVTANGDAALAAGLVAVRPDLKLPLEVRPLYGLPAYTGQHTLVVIVALTEADTVAALAILHETLRRYSQAVVITSSETLLQAAAERDVVRLAVPPPKPAEPVVLYALNALLSVSGLIGAFNVTEGLEADADWLRSRMAAWAPTVAAGRNPAKQLAQEMAGKSAVVYAGPLMYPAAISWKYSLNRYAKHVAWSGRYPEAVYSDVPGWSRQPVNKPYVIVDIRSGLEPPLVQTQIDLADRLLSGRRPAPLPVQAEGRNLLQQQLYALTLGQFTAVYLALLAGIDPAADNVSRKLDRLIREEFA